MSDEDIVAMVQKWIVKFRPHLHPKDIRDGINSCLKEASWFTQMDDTAKVCLVSRVELIVRKQWTKKAERTREKKKEEARRRKAREKQLHLL